MKKKKQPAEYQDGNIKGFIRFISETHGIDEGVLRMQLTQQFPVLAKKSHCPNCEASMKIDLYYPDVIDALLLVKMAQEVKRKMEKGMSFTDANCVHVPTMAATDGIRHRTTRCSYLNYIKQPDGMKQSGSWVITNWGWKALRGERVPRTVKYFRGELISRGEDTVTLSEMFKTHTDKVKSALARRKQARSDYRADISEYNPSDWVGFGGTAEGKLF